MSSIWAVHERKRSNPASTPKRNDISKSTNSENGNLCKFEDYIQTCSPIYRRIIAIKYNYGHNHRVSTEFENRRKQYRILPETSFRDQFEQIFAGINHAVGNLFTGDKVGVFLDLGCAPGGFSKFILDNNASARGLGITLLDIPIVTEGTRLADTKRYMVQEGDITTLNFDARSSKYRPPSARVKLEETGYDLIIAGAFPTMQKVSAAARATLALSQLHAILSNLQPQGTCIVVANTKTFLWNLEMFAVLRRVFMNIQPAKHGELHAIRSSCYFVCTGFDAEQAEALSLKRKVKWALDSLKARDTEDKVSAHVISVKKTRIYQGLPDLLQRVTYFWRRF
jgi:23S rRNA U2552 (ribose-2'-O)-methylase RlmE/FtsJ